MTVITKSSLFKTYIFSTFLLFIISCSHEEVATKSYHYSGNSRPTSDSLKVNIQLSDLSNFNQLFTKIDSVVCLGENKRPILIIEKNDTIYNLEAANYCPMNSVIGCYNERYEISIKPDSIYVSIDYIIAIDSLKSILDKHIINENNDYQFSNSPQKAIISFSADSITDIKTIEKTLLNTFEHFNAINARKGDSLPLHIRFEKELWIDYMRSLGPLPPPPPLIKEVEVIN